VAVDDELGDVGEEPVSEPPQAAARRAPQKASRFIYTDPVLLVILLLLGIEHGRAPATRLAVGCTVVDDPDGRIYELRRHPEPDGDWMLMMHSRKAGSSPVILPLPDAKPDVSATRVVLSYETLNGGRHVDWRVTASGARLDVHANFELEVNIEPDLDPRVELMNTGGEITNLTCEIAPGR
jgi:hypothetical protein